VANEKDQTRKGDGLEPGRYTDQEVAGKRVKGPAISEVRQESSVRRQQEKPERACAIAAFSC
jgi:hypothetical protein